MGKEHVEQRTLATCIAVASDLALLRDARFDGPLVLIRIQAGDRHNPGGRLIPGDGANLPVLWTLPITSTSAIAPATIAATSAITT
jgi:hypothetical protein